jgi:hypothetical protein
MRVRLSGKEDEEEKQQRFLEDQGKQETLDPASSH